MEQFRCKKCGGTLKEKGDKYVCLFCNAEYKEDKVKKETEILRNLLNEEKQEKVANLRSQLWQEIHKEYTDSDSILDIATKIKEYLPDDFQANFYYLANGDSTELLNDFIDNTDVEEQREYIDDIINFMIKSLSAKNLLAMNNLIERAYKNSDLAKYEEYATKLSEEAKKIDDGVYEPSLSRDVFIAYKSQDMKQVTELVNKLEDNDISCFVALRNLQHGIGAVNNYEKAIKVAIDNCKIFVFVSSKNSRTLRCDAVKVEIPYLKKLKDKQRIEYLLDSYDDSALTGVEKDLKRVFKGCEYCYSADNVVDRVVSLLLTLNENTDIKYCANCGKENDRQAKFCSECGNTEFVNSYAEYEKAKDAEQQEEKNQALKQAEMEKQAMAQRLAEMEKQLNEYKNNKATESADPHIENNINNVTDDSVAGKSAADDSHKKAITAEELFNRGMAFYNGTGVRKNYVEAFRCLKKSAVLGDSEAQYYVGLLFLNGQGTNVDKEEAFKWYKKSAEQGNSNGQNALGNCYKVGVGVKKDYVEAVKWYTLSANQGNPKAQQHLGYCYENGEGVKRDYVKAAQWYQKAADQGDGIAENNLGAMYEQGKGVVKNSVEAANLIKRAAFKGVASAINSIGTFFKRGFGVKTDYVEAFNWYKKGAENGDAESQQHLAWCYEKGEGTEVDYEKALYWYKKSAHQGVTTSMNNIAMMYEAGRGVEQSYTEAFRWLLKAAQMNNDMAQYNLATYYERGLGTEVDYDQAYHWYQLAHKNGNKNAQDKMANLSANCYKEGGTNKYKPDEKIFKSVLLPDGSYKITGVVDNNIETVEIPQSVSIIDRQAFFNCEHLYSVVITDSVKRIGDYAFSECKCLEDIFIPESVISMGVEVFSGCASYLTIQCEAQSKPFYWDSDWNKKGSAFFKGRFETVWGV